MTDRELLDRKGHEVNDDLPPLPEPRQIVAAPMTFYSPEDQAFFRFWYGHMIGDLMQPPLANIAHQTARYIWDAAVLAEREQIGSMLHASANNLAPEGKRTNQVDRHVADVLRRMADAIRKGTP